MQNKKMTVLVILGIAAVISLLYGIITPAKGRREISLKKLSVSHDKAGILQKDILMTREKQRTSFDTWGRNPFLLHKDSLGKFALNGILWDDGNPMAIVNDEVVGVGDKIGTAVIVEITKGSIISFAYSTSTHSLLYKRIACLCLKKLS